MQLVIDIPDNVYGLLKYFEEAMGLNDKEAGDDNVKTALMRAVVNGIPLPEHHGRLGDLDKLYTEMNNGIKAGLHEDGYENYGHINDMEDCLECVKYADVLIEADKAESEGNA